MNIEPAIGFGKFVKIRISYCVLAGWCNVISEVNEIMPNLHATLRYRDMYAYGI